MFLSSLCRRWRLASFVLISGVSGQYFQGQFYTNGLSIISAPQPGSTEHTGSTLSIAISLSGQGNLTALNAGDSSSFGAGYDHVALFLVSATQNLNLSVSNELLGQESGSNVKHANYQIPTCLQPGSYNLTLYETSRFNNQPLFAITQVPLNIENSNSNPSGPCASDQQLLSQPQSTSPLSASPWLEGITTVSHVTQGAVAVFASVNNNINQANSVPSSLPPPPPSPPAAPPPPPPGSTTQTTLTSPTEPVQTRSVTVTTTQVTTISLSDSDGIVTKTVTVTTVMAAITNDPNDSNGILFPASAGISLRPSFPVLLLTSFTLLLAF